MANKKNDMNMMYGEQKDKKNMMGKDQKMKNSKSRQPKGNGKNKMF